MDEGFRSMDAKIEQRCTALAVAQIDLREKMDEGFRRCDDKFDSLGEKLTTLSGAVADLHGLQKAVLWMLGAVVSLAGLLITAGKALHWF
jgi:hypothetical protein